jgi:hypothetical protein
MTVYITNEIRRRDVSEALEFGSLQVVIPADMQVTANEDKRERVVMMIEDALETFSDNDYLLLSGDPVSIGICFTVAALNNKGKVRALKWDRIEEKYYPVSIKIDIGE